MKSASWRHLSFCYRRLLSTLVIAGIFLNIHGDLFKNITALFSYHLDSLLSYLLLLFSYYLPLLSNCPLWSTNNAQNEYKYNAVFVLQRTGWTGFLLLTNQLAGFPAPIPFRFACFCHAFPVN